MLSSSSSSSSSRSSSHPSRSRRVIVGLLLLTAVACGGGVATIDGTSSSGGSSSSSSGGSSGTSGTTSPTGTSTTIPTTTSTTTSGRVPKLHRAVAKACDGVRPNNEPVGIPDAGPATPNGYVSCYHNAECTAGKNGRCIGNGHDGWYCTYDACQSDDECGGKSGGTICECEGGFRSDYNTCVPSNCHVDKDCGGNGYCSPTLGSCGHYSKTAGYYCHTPQDECIDDEDCTGQGQFGAKPYCRYEETVGHWKCSTQECAG